MWFSFAIGSAVFAAVASILSKVGLKNIPSTLATALRTIVVVVFAWIVVLLVGSHRTIPSITGKTFCFLILSGLATGASWLCYFKALQLGDINKVVPIDKSSTVMTMIFALVFLGEGLAPIKFISMFLLSIGIFLMLEKQQKTELKTPNRSWMIYAFGSAIFASMTAILGKIGIQGVESNLGTAIRTMVVLVMSWLIVLFQGKHLEIKRMDKGSWFFILFSGLATGLSWLCYYRALQEGPASVVVPIDKLSIVITVAFGSIFLKEKLKVKSFFGLCFIVVGTLLLLI